MIKFSKKYTCPKCGMDEVTTACVQMFMAIGHEHLRPDIEAHDDDSPSQCLECEWQGFYHQLTLINDD